MLGEKKSLTALRGIAAILVVVFHFRHSFGSGVDLDGTTQFFALGYLWVDFFFVLSGFILSYVYQEQFLRNVNLHDSCQFLIRRLARIYPLHIFVLLCFVGFELAKYLVGPANYATPPFEVNTLDSLMANMLLVHAWTLNGSPDEFRLLWNGPSWSISTEFAAYILFPILAFSLLRCRAWVCVALVLGLATSPSLLTLNSVNYLLLRCIVLFMLGVSLFALQERIPKRFWKSRASNDALLCAMAVAILIQMHFGIKDGLIIPLFCGIILVAGQENSRVSTALSMSPLLYLGKISYSVYMIHALVLLYWGQFAKRVLDVPLGAAAGPLWFVAALVTVILGSALTYNLIEVRGQRLVNRMLNRRRGLWIDISSTWVRHPDAEQSTGRRNQ